MLYCRLVLAPFALEEQRPHQVIKPTSVRTRNKGETLSTEARWTDSYFFFAYCWLDVVFVVDIQPWALRDSTRYMTIGRRRSAWNKRRKMNKNKKRSIEWVVVEEGRCCGIQSPIHHSLPKNRKCKLFFPSGSACYFFFVYFRCCCPPNVSFISHWIKTRRG